VPRFVHSYEKERNKPNIKVELWIKLRGIAGIAHGWRVAYQKKNDFASGDAIPSVMAKFCCRRRSESAEWRCTCINH